VANDGDQTRTVNRWVAFLFGALWLAGGGAAVAASTGVGFTASDGAKLPGNFEVNGLHGSLMIVAGLALVGAALVSRRAARITNLVVGVAWVAMDVFALITGKSSLNVLAINDHDADLLLLAALALLAVGLILDRPRTSGSGPKYRTVRYGQGAQYVDRRDLAEAARRTNAPR
jgi:hypothetical protein